MSTFRAFLILALTLAHWSSRGSDLTSIADAMRLDDESCLQPHPFSFIGQILSDDIRDYFLFRDRTGGIELGNHMTYVQKFPRGSMVKVRGDMLMGENGVRQFRADSIEFIRQERMNPPVNATIADILDGRMDFQLVRIAGVISTVIPDEVDDKVCWATLRTPSGKIFLTLFEKWNNANALQSVIDAEVSITGLAAPMTGLRRNLGHRITLGDSDSIDIVHPPPKDPFSSPDLSDTYLPHRQKAHGIVLASEPSRFFLKTATGRILSVTSPISQNFKPPIAGDIATVAGFADNDPYRTQLSDAIVRVDGHDADPEKRPVPRTIESLFVNDKGGNQIDSCIDGTFITTYGILQSDGQNELKVSDGRHTLSLDRETLNGLRIKVPSDGCTVAIQGICIVEFEHPPTPSIYPTFKRFVLIPRAPSDIVILAHPSWWTPFRLTVLVLILAAILLGSTAWNVMLKRKSEKRGRELYAEKIDHALAEQKVEERTRLAVELHDSVSQTLTGVALQLDGGEVETAKAMLASCRGELRRCLWDLRSRTFEEKDMTEAVTRTITPHLNGVEATVRFNVPRERLSESLTHAILRIIRELVVNAIRHGQAKHIRIAGEMHGSTVSFSVADDGCGFVPETAPGPKQGHFGLLGIRERIEDFNGDLQIASVPGKGAKFTVTLTTTDETNEH